MACCYFIKTNSDVVVEYHEYEGAGEDFMPSPEHVKLAGKPTLEPFGRYYRSDQDPPFSQEYAPGFGPREE